MCVPNLSKLTEYAIFSIHEGNGCQLERSAVADLRGARGTRGPPPPAQNFFLFMQFSGKIGQIIGWRPLLWEILDPPLVCLGSVFTDRKRMRSEKFFDVCRLHILIFSDGSLIFFAFTQCKRTLSDYILKHQTDLIGRSQL